MRPVGSVVGIVLAVVASDVAFAQTTTRVSVSSAGFEANGFSWDPAITPDGRFVAFRSTATNLVAHDANGKQDIFFRDLSTKVTELVSVSSSGGQGNGDCQSPACSADGRFVAFTSGASNLVAGDTNKSYDAFVHDRVTGTTERVSVDSSGGQGNLFTNTCAISADGLVVTFDSGSSNLVPNDTNGTNDIFVHDRVSGITERISVDSSGVEGNAASYPGRISSDGKFVVFFSLATNLVAGDTNGVFDVFVHDRSTGVTERVSVDSAGSQGDDASYDPAISADGLVVAFSSGASNLVLGDTNGYSDVFVHDRASGITERVSVDSKGAEGNDGSAGAFISPNGFVVTFSSAASNLVTADTNRRTDVFVHDRLSKITERVSVNSSGIEGNDDSASYSISDDGQFVGFSSNATNLVPADRNAVSDCFLRDRGLAPPVALSVTPNRTLYSNSPDVTIHGAYLLNGTNTQVAFGPTPATNVVVVDDSTITCTAPSGIPGPATVTVTNSLGSSSIADGFIYTPATLMSGDPSLGGQVTIDYLCDPLDGILAIAGLPPEVNIPTPPFGGTLCISPFTNVFWIPANIWPYDDLTFILDIPNDPSLSGLQVLLQALIGPSFAKPKDAAWTNCVTLTIG